MELAGTDSKHEKVQNIILFGDIAAASYYSQQLLQVNSENPLNLEESSQPESQSQN